MQTMCRTIKFKCPLDEATWVTDLRAPAAAAGTAGVRPIPGEPLKRDLGTQTLGTKSLLPSGL